MERTRFGAWAALPLVVLACGVVQADCPPTGFEVSVPEQPRRFPVSSEQARGTPPPMQLALRQPDFLAPGSPFRPIQPGPPAGLTLEDLERMALESNPTLVQARMAVQAAQGQYLQARLYPNPSIGYICDEAGNDGSSGLQGGSVSQEIVTAGKRRLERAAAGHQVVQARHGWEAQRRRVLNDVRAGYYEVLVAQKMVDVNQQLVRIGDEGLKATDRLLELQEVTRAELLQVRIDAERARLSLQEARNQHWIAWRRLAAVLGRPEMEPAGLAGNVVEDLPILNREDTLARLLAQSPELARAWAGVERARCQLALQYAQRRPNLEIEAAAKYDTGSEFTVADVALSVPLPLFNRNQGNIVSAQADLIAAENEVRRIELDLHDRFSAAFGQYANARQQVETYLATILPNAQASLDLIRKGYRDGVFGYLTLLTAQRTYFSVNLEYLAKLRELWARIVELEGMLLSGGLEAPE